AEPRQIAGARVNSERDNGSPIAAEAFADREQILARWMEFEPRWIDFSGCRQVRQMACCRVVAENLNPAGPIGSRVRADIKKMQRYAHASQRTSSPEFALTASSRPRS